MFCASFSASREVSLPSIATIIFLNTVVLLLERGCVLKDADIYLPVLKNIPRDQWESGWLGDIAAALFEVINVSFDNILSRYLFQIGRHHVVHTAVYGQGNQQALENSHLEDQHAA